MDPTGVGDVLLDRLRRRDETVLPLLVNHHGPRLAAVVAATWRGIPEHELEEIVADVVADAWFHSEEVDPARAPLGTWLAMRARFRTLDRLRARARERSLLVRLTRFVRPASTGSEYATDLDAYLAGLTELERALVWLRFVEGRPLTEVAALCGLTAKAVERRLARLRARLRDHVAAGLEIGVTNHA